MDLVVVGGVDSGKKIDLNKAGRFIIGREAALCTLALSDPLVSRKHAEILLDFTGSVTIVDHKSHNGTFLNGIPVQGTETLKPGDRITVGNTTIELFYGISDKTTPNSTVNPAYNPKQLYASAKGASITIGRDRSNDLVLEHPHVSRFHAVVEGIAENWYIKDLNSTNGTYLNGIRITTKSLLSANSVIRISGYRLTVDDFRLVKHDETAGQVELEVRDLSKVVMLPGGRELVLLNNISFKVGPREFVAILGGSGTGKSTLLKALLGIDPASFGEILINGANYYEEYGAFKSMVGYVPQDDIVHLELTVEEVLSYAARLRMPDDTSMEERNRRIEEVLEALELTARRNTPVKKLSGGQRKRVSIGVEIITMPSIMFLDEPTSGLDPGLEKLMMQMMRNMANRGQTIFCITHATFNIHLCDKVLFLTEGGRLAFFGTPQEACAYFKTDDFAEIYRMVNLDDSPEHWQLFYNQSNLAKKYYPHCNSNNVSAYSVKSVATKESSVRQWLALTSRYLKVMTRDRKNLLLLFLQPVIIAIGVGLLFSGDDFLEKSPYLPQDLTITEAVIMDGRFEEVSARIDLEMKRINNIKVVLLVTVLTAVWFGAANSVSEIVKENAIYKRERSVNLSIAPYLLSKALVLSIVCFAQSFVFVAILRLLIGLPNFLLFVMAFFLIISASAMMGLAVSACVASTSSATSMLPLLLLPQVILSGGLIAINELEPEFVQSFFALAISKWGYELVGGGILDVNNLVGLETPFAAFEGTFGAHWFWLVGHFCAYYLLASIAMLGKDKNLA